MYILEQRSSCGTSRVRPSWPHSWHRLNTIWPLLMSMHLVATPNPVSSCLWQWFNFHPNIFCYLGGFSLMYCTSKHHNNVIWYRAHTYCIYITLAFTYSYSSFYTFSIFLGRLAVLHSLYPLQLSIYFIVDTYCKFVETSPSSDEGLITVLEICQRPVSGQCNL